jgi:hypothetical protein
MTYGFCYKRLDKKGRMYTTCPGYKTKATLNAFIPGANKEKLVKKLENDGFGKHARAVATKMLKSGKGMEDYSKKTGLLKKGK